MMNVKFGGPHVIMSGFIVSINFTYFDTDHEKDTYDI